MSAAALTCWSPFDHPDGWRVLLASPDAGEPIRGLIAPSERPGPGGLQLDPVRFTSAVWPTLTAAHQGRRPRWARHVALVDVFAMVDGDGHRWAEQAAHDAPVGFLRCSAQTATAPLRAIRGLA